MLSYVLIRQIQNNFYEEEFFSSRYDVYQTSDFLQHSKQLGCEIVIDCDSYDLLLEKAYDLNLRKSTEERVKPFIEGYNKAKSCS